MIFKTVSQISYLFQKFKFQFKKYLTQKNMLKKIARTASETKIELQQNNSNFINKSQTQDGKSI